ncbi:MAG: hypothetical protein IPO15_11150 [Anaerolineae bacterium]|uniref:hypothetical protein n=1 Tax=Candidatus Amarolinea dominans TaxID=3140696 RepID=UPI003136E677|nr:hypothetical protein [Anaerolineae bacterium]
MPAAGRQPWTTATSTASPLPTATATRTPTATATRTPTVTATRTPTATPTAGSTATPTPTVTPGGGAPRAWPDTSSGVHVFNDQLSQGMTQAQVQFIATHYAGTQKMIRSEADRLRAVNPNFLILHYRLGHGPATAPFRTVASPPAAGCAHHRRQRLGAGMAGQRRGAEPWFFHWPETGGPRVLNCDKGLVPGGIEQQRLALLLAS